MNPRRPPPPPGFMLALTGGVIGSGLLVLGAMLALDALAPPVPALGSTGAQVVMIAVGLVLVAFEVRAVLAYARSRQGPDAD